MPLNLTTVTWNPRLSLPFWFRRLTLFPLPVPVPAVKNVENYIRRLQKLEELTGSYPGVDKAFAIQAGREVRIMVKPEVVTEDNMILLARDIAKKIEAELEYPGQIKVNVIRETKAVEYAK